LWRGAYEAVLRLQGWVYKIGFARWQIHLDKDLALCQQCPLPTNREAIAGVEFARAAFLNRERP